MEDRFFEEGFLGEEEDAALVHFSSSSEREVKVQLIKVEIRQPEDSGIIDIRISVRFFPEIILQSDPAGLWPRLG